MPNYKSLDLSKSLRVKPNQVIHYLKIPLGSKVYKGDLLCLKKNLFGKKIEIFSPIEGIISSLEEETGYLIIKDIGDKKDQVQTTVPVKKTKNGLNGLFGFGKTEGKLKVLPKSLTLALITKNEAGLILYAPKILSKGVLYKADALEVSGLVVAETNPELEKEINKIKFELDFSFLVLGKIPEILSKWDGKHVCCDGENKQLILVSKLV